MTCLNKKIFIVTVITFFNYCIFLNFAFCQIDRKGKKYLELNDNISPFSMIIDTSKFQGLLRKVVPGATKDSIPREFKVGTEEYELAGFCFIPIWQIGQFPTENSVSRNNPDSTFFSIGLRITVIFWKKNANCETGGLDLVIVAGGFNRIGKALHPLDSEFSNLVKQGFAIEEFFAESNQENMITPYSTEERERFLGLSEEFDFVFLEYDDYLDLAISDRFYPKAIQRDPPTIDEVPDNSSVRKEFGLVIERSLIKYEVWDATKNDFVAQDYRSLSFRPYPVPTLPNETTEAAIAIVDPPRCPPYWRNFESQQQTRSEYLHTNLVEIACPNSYLNNKVNSLEIVLEKMTVLNEVLREESQNRLNELTKLKENITDLMTENKKTRISASVHSGRNFRTNNFRDFSSGNNFYEVDIEYFPGNNSKWSFEALVGRYEFEADSQVRSNGFSLSLKRYFSFTQLEPKFLPRFSFYLSGGIGTYSIFKKPETGVVGNLGVRFPLLYGDQKIYFELGGQYHNLALISNQTLDIQLLAFKIGIKLYLKS